MELNFSPSSKLLMFSVSSSASGSEVRAVSAERSELIIFDDQVQMIQ